MKCEYGYRDAAPTWANSYLWPVLKEELARLAMPAVNGKPRAFDLGCGSGATANMLAELGFDVVGVDPSTTGIAEARKAYPGCRFEIGSAYDDLAAAYGRFPLLVSLEVVEHCYDPRHFARTVFQLLEPGGVAIVSTPYHGYLKNVALAVTGKLDAHFTALWDGGHIKFFSMATLGQLLDEAGLCDIKFRRVGRVPVLAKSMLAIARRPT
jgi:2-polyprenyl-6-hydroxyphenyl methylase/3-demethylubiquinone-9 3-methyltransferase